jgi:hypothetical protein
MRASEIKPITYMKTHSAELVAAVNKKRRPVCEVRARLGD